MHTCAHTNTHVFMPFRQNVFNFCVSFFALHFPLFTFYFYLSYSLSFFPHLITLTITIGTFKSLSRLSSLPCSPLSPSTWSSSLNVHNSASYLCSLTNENLSKCLRGKFISRLTYLLFIDVASMFLLSPLSTSISCFLLFFVFLWFIDLFYSDLVLPLPFLFYSHLCLRISIYSSLSLYSDHCFFLNPSSPPKPVISLFYL